MTIYFFYCIIIFISASINKGVIAIKIQRNTPQKKIILDAVKNTGSHPTVEEIYSEVKKSHPSISKNTVYRNLRLLAENGDIRKIGLPGELERYDRLTDRHYHYQCKKCGRITDVKIEYLERIDETVRLKYGIDVDGHDIVFSGVCPLCVKSGGAVRQL